MIQCEGYTDGVERGRECAQRPEGRRSGGCTPSPPNLALAGWNSNTGWGRGKVAVLYWRGSFWYNRGNILEDNLLKIAHLLDSFRPNIKKIGLMSVLALCVIPQVVFASGGGGEGAPDMTERMMSLVIQLGIILFAARAGGRLFELMGMPGVLGELCTGIVIGPSLLGGIPIPGFPHGIFYLDPLVQCGTTAVSPELYGICTLASVTLLFLVGVETDLKLLMRYVVAGGLVGLGGVVFSFVLGDVLGMALLKTVMTNSNGGFGFFHPACIFLGVMSTATSVSITARILSEKRKLDSPEGVTILAGAVIDDVLGIIMLAIGTGIAVAAGKGDGAVALDWGEIGKVAAKAIGVWLGATVVGLVSSHYISRFLKNCFDDKAQIATMALGFSMIVAGLFEEAHLAMIIGAYVLGLSLSRTDISHVIREYLQPIYFFLVPVFFVVMGMLVDIKAFTKPEVLFFGAIYTVAALLSKFIGCGLPTLFCGFNLRGAMRVGLGMIPRGEVALIVAGQGLSNGMINQDVFGVAVLMTLLTTIIPPPLVVQSFKSSKSGLRKNAEHETKETPDMVFYFASGEATRLILNALLDVFSQEGFFVHALNLKDSVYQVLKDDKVINIVGLTKERKVVFKCTEEDSHFVQTVMREVIAGLEQTIRALRTPLDPDAILTAQGSGYSEEEVSRKKTRNARMKRYLSEKLMVPNLVASTKEEAIRQLVKILFEHGCIKDEETVYEAVMQREQSMSTGLRHGFACPHARTEEVKDLVCVIALLPEGVPFDSVDGKLTHVIQLILSPTDTPAPYMEFMAAMSSIYTGDGREALLTCTTSKAMHKELCSRLG